MLIQWHLQVVHPQFWPIAVLLAIMAFAFMLSVVCVFANLWQRPAMSALAILGLIPVGVIACPLDYAAKVSADRVSTNDPSFQFAQVFGAAVMEWQVSREYKHLYISRRLVMLCNELDSPEKDLAAMESYVARLERRIGHASRDRIWWVRGELFNRRMISFMGLSFGSWRSPAGELDRHELAHSVIWQLKPPNADPPSLLVEGWAESQSVRSEQELAEWALKVRESGDPTALRTLVSPFWYHRHDGAVYPVGGAFVQFLIRRYGMPQFTGLYTRTNPRWFINAVPIILGTDFDKMERELWQDTERIARNNNARRQL
jgi:hypothetical protein